ncbi:MAG: Nramp family divalent metal transporter, partial [Methylocella sp.]
MPLSAVQTIPLESARSLGAAYGSVHVPKTGPVFHRFMSFAGPGYLVATGYMDPGNWATAIAGGATFGMALLFIAVLSSLMAIVLQALSARLAFATGRDLAQNCGQAFPRLARLGFWLIIETAIVATDLAEVIGTAIGLELLTGLPLGAGVVLTSLDALLVLAFMRFGFRKLEAFVVTLLILIASCFAIELVLARPDMADVANALLPSRDIFTNPEMLYIALGILGATVMPHNLYLHSGIVLTRAVGPSHAEKASAIRLAILDSTIALLFALLINGSILI